MSEHPRESVGRFDGRKAPLSADSGLTVPAAR